MGYLEDYFAAKKNVKTLNDNLQAQMQQIDQNAMTAKQALFDAITEANALLNTTEQNVKIDAGLIIGTITPVVIVPLSDAP